MTKFVALDLETTGLSRKQLQELLDPAALTKGGVRGGSSGR